MSFKPWEHDAFTDTPRKRSALRRKQRLKREALPLFAEQIRADYPSTPVIVAQRNRMAVLKKEEDVSPAGDNWHKASLSNNLNSLGDHPLKRCSP